MRRSTDRCSKNFGSQASDGSSIVTPDLATARSSGRDGLAHEIADAREEVGAHGWMEALRVRAADREQAKTHFTTERHERGGADLYGAGAEQEIALAVANLSATRPRRFEQRLEHLQ